MAVSKSGNVFVWGSNIRGQLGYDPKICKYLSVPTKIVLGLKDVNTFEEEKKEVTEDDMQVDSVQASGDQEMELEHKENFNSVAHGV